MVRERRTTTQGGLFTPFFLGPIVRINHQEVHIDDLDFYDTLYNFNPQLDKMECAIGTYHSPVVS
jgi:hypothetical protein